MAPITKTKSPPKKKTKPKAAGTAKPKARAKAKPKAKTTKTEHVLIVTFEDGKRSRLPVDQAVTSVEIAKTIWRDE